MARRLRAWHGMHGTIDTLITERGFGFITDDDGRRYFFQRNALMGVDYEDLSDWNFIGSGQGQNRVADSRIFKRFVSVKNRFHINRRD